MNWKDNFRKGRELILATSSKKGIPNANIVISLGFVDDRLLVADCQMKTTIKNLRENRNICIIAGYSRMNGVAKIFSSGKYYNLCLKGTKEYKVKNAILINVKKAFDLDKGKNIL
jgi:hypothetical protein